MKTLDTSAVHKMLIEHMNEAVWMGDENEVTVYANPKFCEIMEYTLEEMMGRKSYDFWDEESTKKVRSVNENERKQGVSSSYEGTLVTKSGKHIPVLLSGTPLPDGGTIGIMTDLRELKKKESIYRRLVENMNEAVWMGDENEVTVYANPKFCEIMEYTLEEMIGRKSYDFWDEESTKKVRAVNEGERKRGISSSYEGTLVTKSGKRIPVLLSGTPLPDGGTIGIMTDLRELKNKESIYRRLVENMNEAVWMGDENEVTVYANPKFCEIMEYTLEEMIGRKSYDFWDEESTKKVRAVNEGERKRGISSSYEGTLVTKSGKRIPVLLSGTPLPDGGTIGIMTDLRELKKKEEKELVLSKALLCSKEGVIIFNQEGVIDSWSKGSKIIFGYTEDEILGKPLDTIFQEKDVALLRSQSEVKYNFELEGKHKNTQKLVISATISPIPGVGQKETSLFLLITRDITAERRFEEELALKYQKMRDAYNQFGIIRRQMDYIFELADVCSEYHDQKVIADFVVNSAVMLTRVDACVLRLYDAKKGTMELASSFGMSEDWQGKTPPLYKGSLVEKAFEQHSPLKVIDLTKESRYTSLHLARKHNFSSLLVIPLSFQSEFLGALSLYVTPDRRLEIFENDFIEEYAKLVGIVLAKVKASSSRKEEVVHSKAA